MKAITLTQPWATLIALGAKRIETRSWRTNYRGLLAIHAANHAERGLPRWVWDWYTQNGFARAALGITSYTGLLALPSGMVIATAMLVDIQSTTTIDADDRERAFGDYSAGRFAWRLDDVNPLPQPIPAKGSLGLWNFEYNAL